MEKIKSMLYSLSSHTSTSVLNPLESIKDKKESIRDTMKFYVEKESEDPKNNYNSLLLFLLKIFSSEVNSPEFNNLENFSIEVLENFIPEMLGIYITHKFNYK